MVVEVVVVVVLEVVVPSTVHVTLHHCCPHHLIPDPNNTVSSRLPSHARVPSPSDQLASNPRMCVLFRSAHHIFLSRIHTLPSLASLCL
ncbi:hypothetical protein E2C01_064415 [Portunus trituberculatus]|uniref:Secreted protein n=1 Tax=Portunus trituberculatus TaxID=210409 RepID=A0A5B7HNP9_PORTR|nr:hypothetical protein [Portunus trituberculatus]